MTRTTGAPLTGPAWEPKIIGARELWAIRESFKFCDTTQISDAVLDTMVNIMDGTTDPDEWIPEPRYPYQGLRIVRVDDLRAIAELLAYDEYNVDMTSQEERDRYWRIVALIGEAE